MFLKGWNKKRLLVLVLDTALILLAYTLAFLLRFEFKFAVLQSERFLATLPLLLLIKPIVFLLSNLYRSIWRYASLSDAFEIYKTVSFASIFYTLGLIFSGNQVHISRSIIILDWLILFVLMAGSRVAWRFCRENQLFRGGPKGDRTLIVGAGEAGSMLLKEIRRQPTILYNVMGFIDDDAAKQGMRLHGVQVWGGTEQLAQIVEKMDIEKVIIAIPSASRKKIRDIVHGCKKAGVKFKTLPGLTELINGDVTVSHIKDVEIEDLLGRDPVKLDEAAIHGYLRGKRVLVTGAGGSIGSEICRQIARFGPGKIIILDSAETPLFFIEKELAAAWPQLPLIPVLCDIRNGEKVDRVFGQFLPEVVFHAAAYKHVPMMELNPVEAVSNNIGGTKNVADVADRYKVADFVMISTDKAVNPTNIMGASKRIAELYVQALAAKSATKFTAVRFGNVMGSNGSVIPMFKEQIRNGGPVTVTDAKVVRYFMTIPEASQLVLQSGCLGKGGEIFVLDMGEPVPILELAEELIRLSGLVPYVDVDITFTGLRPGEKLFEELLIAGEGIGETVHEKIKVLTPAVIDRNRLASELDLLFAAARAFDLPELVAMIQLLVPEFNPSYMPDGDYSPTLKRMRPDIFSVPDVRNAAA